jgi:hypothetical protein
MTNQERARVLSAIAGEGGYEEFVAQAIASVIASAPLNFDEATKWTASIMSRVFDLVNNDQEKIWPELMPGPGSPPETDPYNYEVIWWDNDTRVGKAVEAAESPLNLVGTWNRAPSPCTHMSIKHVAGGELTLWTQETADAVLKLDAAIKAMEKIGVRDTDFGDLYQEVYEDAIDRGGLWKKTHDA